MIKLYVEAPEIQELIDRLVKVRDQLNVGLVGGKDWHAWRDDDGLPDPEPASR